MGLTQGELNTIQLIIDIGSILSVIGSGAIILSVICTRNFLGKEKIWNRFIFFISLCDMCASIDFIVRKLFLKEGSFEDKCGVQGLTIQFFFISSILWTTAIAFNIFFVAILDKNVNELEKYEYIFHVIVWGLSLLLTVPLAILDHKEQSRVMGDATFWCWITENYSGYRMLFFFGPVWIVFFFNAFVYISVEIIYRKKHKENINKSRNPIARRSDLYLLVLFITWIWGTINRVQNMISDNGNQIFILYLLHALFTPLQGFMNSIVYFWYSVLEHFLAFKRAVRKEEEAIKQANEQRHNRNNDPELEKGKKAKSKSHKHRHYDQYDNYYVYPTSHSSSNSINNNSTNSIKKKQPTIERPILVKERRSNNSIAAISNSSNSTSLIFK